MQLVASMYGGNQSGSNRDKPNLFPENVVLLSRYLLFFPRPIILPRPARASRHQLVADASLWDCRLLVFCEGPYAHLCSNIGTATEATGVASGTVVKRVVGRSIE